MREHYDLYAAPAAHPDLPSIAPFVRGSWRRDGAISYQSTALSEEEFDRISKARAKHHSYYRGPKTSDPDEPGEYEPADAIYSDPYDETQYHEDEEDETNYYRPDDKSASLYSSYVRGEVTLTNAASQEILALLEQEVFRIGDNGDPVWNDTMKWKLLVNHPVDCYNPIQISHIALWIRDDDVLHFRTIQDWEHGLRNPSTKHLYMHKDDFRTICNILPPSDSELEAEDAREQERYNQFSDR